MASIPRRISPTCCPTSRTTPFIVLRTSCLGTLLCGRSARAKKPINTFLNVSTFATWTRSSRLCQYGSDWTLTKGQRTVQEIASSYSVHPTQVTSWRKQLLDFSTEAFSTGRQRSDQFDEQLKTELYAEIGKLKVELDWLQKKSGLSR